MLYAPNNTAADTIIVKVSISISVIHECYMLLIITAADTIIVKVSKYICNPRVLYAPNNTAADTIIVMVNISISVIHECYMLLIIRQLIPLL